MATQIQTLLTEGMTWDEWVENGRTLHLQTFTKRADDARQWCVTDVNLTLSENGVLLEETWKCDGKRHRTDGPAVQQWYPDGSLMKKEWLQNGWHHRIDGPAMQQWNVNGRLRWEEWSQNGRTHRTDGAAVHEWGSDGTAAPDRWFMGGLEVPRRMVILAMARTKVLRSSRLLVLGNAVRCVSTDSLTVIGGFM